MDTGGIKGRVIEVVDFRVLILGGAAAVVIYLVMIPLAMLLWTSLKTTPAGVPGPFTVLNFINAYSDPTLYPLFGYSFIFALSAGSLAFFIGGSIAWLVERTNTPLRGLAYTLMLVPMVIPGVLKAIAWVMLTSPRIGIINLIAMKLFALSSPPLNVYSLYMMIWVEALSLTPLTFLLMSGALRSMDPALEEAASTAGAGTISTLRLVTVRMMLPAMAAVWVINFVRAIEGFEAPAVMGVPAGIQVFSTKIYQAAHQSPPDHGLASALGVTLLVITVVGVLLYQKVLARGEKYATISGKAFRPKPIDLGRSKYLGLAFFLTYLLFAVVIPFLTLLWASLLPFYSTPSMESISRVSLTNYWGEDSGVLNYPGVRLALKNSLFLGTITGIGTTCISAIISWIVVKSPIQGRRVLDTLAFIPQAVPGMVLGLALLFAYLTIPNPIYGTVWILMICFMTKYLPYSTRAINGAMIQIHKELEEAAHISGASWFQTFGKIIVPLLLPSFIDCSVYIFIHCLRELSAALLLYSPKSLVLSVLVWEMWGTGSIGQVSALAVLMILFIAACTFIGRKLQQRFVIRA